MHYSWSSILFTSKTSAIRTRVMFVYIEVFCFLTSYISGSIESYRIEAITAVIFDFVRFSWRIWHRNSRPWRAHTLQVAQHPIFLIFSPHVSMSIYFWLSLVTKLTTQEMTKRYACLVLSRNIFFFCEKPPWF